MKRKLNIPVMFCFDTNYVIPAAVAFYSLMEHASKKYDYTFYVLHSDITAYQQNKLRKTLMDFSNCKLEFIDMNNRLDDFWSENYKGGHFSKEVMYKLLVASIFPNIDKIIVSDVDVVFLGDVSESYFDLMDDDDAYIAGVKPIGKVNMYLKNYEKDWTKDEIKKMNNICGGYLVMNLKKIREDNFESVFLKSLDENGYRLNQMEQDIFNITCYNKIKHLHLKYVACSYMWDYYKYDYDMEIDSNYSKEEIKEAMENPVQLHYATSIKPWKNVDCTKSEIWFKYIVKTPFLEDYLKELPNKIVISKDKNKTNLLSLMRKKIYSFFDENDNKRVWRYLRYIYEGLDTLVHYPLILFKGYFYRKLFKKLIIKPFNIIISDELFPSNVLNIEKKEYSNYIHEYGKTYIITCGSAFKENKENAPLNYLVDNTKLENLEYNDKLFGFENYSNENFNKFISEIQNPLLIINYRKGAMAEIENLVNNPKLKTIPLIIIITNKENLNNSKDLRFIKKILSLKNCFGCIIDNIKVKKLLEDKLDNNSKVIMGYEINKDIDKKLINKLIKTRRKVIDKALKKNYRK